MTTVYSYQGAQSRLQREPQYGVTPNPIDPFVIDGLGIRTKPSVEKRHYAPPGSLLATVGTLDDDFTTGALSGVVDFNGLGFVLAGRFGAPVITALGGSPAAFQWDWIWNGRRPLRPVSYRHWFGHFDVADVTPGLICNTLSVEGGRADGFSVSGDVFGKAMVLGQAMGGITREVQTITESGTVTAGNFTITFPDVGGTTGLIAFNANAATIQAAIDATPGIKAGEITVAGGPIDTTPATLTFGGPFWASFNPAQVTVDSSGLTGGTYVPTTSTPWADSAAVVPAVPAGAVMADVWLDSTWAGLGATQLLHAYTMALDLPEGQTRVRPMNSSFGSDDIIDASEDEGQALMLGLTLGVNAVERARIAALRANDKEFVRVAWTGELISGANDYLFRIDAAVDWDDPGDPENTDSVLTRMSNGRVVIDPVSSNAIAFRLVNTVAGLAP